MTPHAPHVELTDALREDIALYAFGLLERDQAADIEQHLDSCTVCNQELRAIENVVSGLSAPAAPPPDLKNRLLTRIQTREEPGVTVHRSGSGTWHRTPWRGVTYQRLHFDAATGYLTSLLRVQPGGRYPSHRHHGDEQSWVLEGSCRIGSVSIRAGDFAVAAAGTVHGVLESEEGCLLLIVSSARDEVLA